MINLQESMGPDQDRTRDPWICSQTPICSQTHYRLRYAARLFGYVITKDEEIFVCMVRKMAIWRPSLLWVMCQSSIVQSHNMITALHTVNVLTFRTLNSVQKLCGTGFSQFPLLYVVIGPTSLWESYSWRPPLISPSGSKAVRASGKALISWEKSENSEMRPQTKSSWRWLPHKIHQYSSICFTSLGSIFKLLKCNTPFTRILNVLITSYNKNDSLFYKSILKFYWS